MIIKEHSNWFTRHNSVNTGADRDRETTFSKTYLVGTLINKFKMLLSGDYPGESVFKKLIKSLTNKLNTNDSAFEQQAGIVQKATDTKAINRDSTDNGIFENDGSISGVSGIAQDTEDGVSPYIELQSTNFATCVLPHQLPNINLSDDVDGTDSIISTETKSGLKLTTLSTLLTDPTNRSRKNFKLEVVPDDTTITINGSEELETIGLTTSFDFINNIEVNVFGMITSMTKTTVTTTNGLVTTVTEDATPVTSTDKLKFKDLNGTTAPTISTIVSVPHGLDVSKIKGFICKILNTAGAYVPQNSAGGSGDSNASVYFDSTSFYVETEATSTDILNKAFQITVIYTE